VLSKKCYWRDWRGNGGSHVVLGKALKKVAAEVQKLAGSVGKSPKIEISTSSSNQGKRNPSIPSTAPTISALELW
jgi:hypothetical protein